MPSGEKPGPLLTAYHNSATAIARGNLLIYNATGDDTKVVIATAAAAKPAGVAYDDSPGQDKTFLMATSGVVKVKVGASVTQGAYCSSDASGLGIDAASGAIRNVYGRFLEAGVNGDLVPVELRVGAYWV